MEFEYDGGGLAKGGAVTLFVDGREVGEGRVDQTEAIVFSADETLTSASKLVHPSPTTTRRTGSSARVSRP